MGGELDTARLRERAKRNLEKWGPVQTLSGADASRLIEELQIHQEELRIQNEELMRAQLELEVSKAKYFQLYDLAPVGYIALDQDLMIKEVNLAASSLLGSDRKGMVNKALSTFISPHCQEELYLHFRKLTHGAENQKNVWPSRRKDGRDLLIQFESNRVDGDSDKGFRSIMTDVTELKRAQQIMSNLSDDLKRSNAELEQFAYVASHDLREPLRMVRSYLDLLGNNYQGKVLDKRAEDYIGMAIDGATRMQEMVNDILAYSQVGSKGKPPHLIDLEVEIGKVLKDLGEEIKSSGAIVTVGPMPEVMADPSQFYKLLQNLLTNALKFRSNEPVRIQLSAEEKDAEWVFSVTDNGIGIPPEQIPRLFQMFQRLHTREEYPGTGIGLALSRKIVERHGGRIWIDSEVGKGSTFFFTLPKVGKE